MASFDELINQTKKNLSFLESVNQKIKNNFDWQVTICFYSAVHIINAHIAKIADLHYRSHEDVNKAINPANQISPAKLDEDNYLAYMKLQNLSRRARYLCHDKPSNKSTEAFLTHDVHLKKALRHLDKLISFINSKHKVEIEAYSLNCIGLNNELVKNFIVSSQEL